MNEISNTDLRRKTLEAIHDSAVDAIITITERGIIETVNPATSRMFGYADHELIGRNVKMLMPSPYRDEHDVYLKNFLTTREAKVIGIGREVEARKKDGSIFPMHLAVSEVELGERRVFAGFIRDLSDLKRSEEQQASLGRIIEDSLNEVFIFDTESFRFIQANRGARENLGYTNEELKQITPVDIKPEYSEETFRELVQPLLRGQVEEVEFAAIHERKNGSTYDVDIHLQLSTYSGQPVFLAIILDVSKRRTAERLFRQQQENMKADLERLVDTRTRELGEIQAELVRSEKFSTLGKVSGGIAHEIRNPLNAVKTSAYYLLNAKNPSAEKIKEHLERIDRQVTIVDNVITALSDVARLPEAELKPVAMAKLLPSVVDSLEFPSDVQVSFQFPENMPDVLADEYQIAIAFKNLIRNARDSIVDQGTIAIEAEVFDDSVVFCIEDDGVGISKTNLGVILEPLFTTKARGMGLGLAITVAIVEKNRGTFSFESELGKGSKFRISLLKS